MGDPIQKLFNWAETLESKDMEIQKIHWHGSQKQRPQVLPQDRTQIWSKRARLELNGRSEVNSYSEQMIGEPTVCPCALQDRVEVEKCGHGHMSLQLSHSLPRSALEVKACAVSTPLYHRYCLMCGYCPGDCPWPSGMQPRPRCASFQWTSSRPTSTSMR